MQQTNFDFLTRETLELSQKLNYQYQSEENDSFPPSNEKIVEPGLGETEDWLERAGVIFYLEVGVNTFCLRAIATDDVEDTFDLIEKNHPSVARVLRIDWSQFDQKLLIFPTESKASAEVLVDHMANRRYPLREDLLCNLSDPGFSWWMDLGQDHFQIFFQSHGVDRAIDFVCLGPMGDPMIACKRLNQALPFLKNYFSIDEFSVTEKAFGISVATPDCPKFNLFRKVFLSGEAELRGGLFPSNPQGRTLSLYFRELALKRRFWCQIERILKKASSGF